MRRLIGLLLSHSWHVALAVGLGSAVIASNMGLLAAAAYLVAAASVTHLMVLLIIPMYAVRLLSATRSSARYAERLVSHHVTLEILAQLRVRLFDRFRQLGPAGMRGIHSGDALARVLGDIEQLQNAYLLFTTPIAVAVLVSALTVAILLAFSAMLAWAILVYLVVGTLVVPLVVGVLARQAGRTLVTARAHLNAHLVESIQGNRDITSNGAGARFLERTRLLGQQVAGSEIRLAAVGAARDGASELVAALAVLTALGLAVPLITNHSLAGLYVAVPALLVLAAFESVRPVAQAAETLGGIQAAAQRVLSIGEGTRVVPEPSSPISLRPPYSVTFDRVTLDYGSGPPVLRQVNFNVPALHRVAIVGPSGAGKTSLVRLLIRAWDPVAGRVAIGGRDIRDFPLHDLRAALSVVTQDTYIFNDTIRSNLLLARPHATRGDMEEALNAAGLLDLVRGLPAGLDSRVGEHGEKLSGGERQRLAVARALLHDAPIVVLDEVTANLDPISECALLETLHCVTERKTVLIVTHRLVGLERMDEIVVLDAGQVVESGTHKMLAQAGGLYRRMLDAQDNMLAV